MKKALLILAAAAAILCGGDLLAASFSLKVDRPKCERSKSQSGNPNKARNSRRGTRKASESVTTVNQYPCKVSCSLARGETSAKVHVEAFFILREKGADSTSMSVETVDGGTFAFSPEEKTHSFSIVSPSCTKTTTVKTSGPRRRRKTEQETTGTTIVGVVVRAVCDGKVVAVRSMPDNSEWNRAAKQSSFALPK